MRKKKVELVSKAYARYLRISPQKTRLVIDLIRGESLPRAFAILANVNKRAKISIEKLLKSALSNARVNPAVKPEELFISKITADGGPMLKRFRAASMGRAVTIRHRTTHLSIELSRAEVQEAVKEKKAQKRQPKKRTKK